MARWTGHVDDSVNNRGIWVRNPGIVERMPSMFGVLHSLQPDDDPTEITPRGIRTITQHNRASITQPPPPARRAVTRPRPSPLFGEGELQTGRPRYTLRETIHMEGRASTLWEHEVTESKRFGRDSMSPASIAIDDDVSVTLEVDTGWYQGVQDVPTDGRRFQTLPSGMNVEGYEDAFPIQSQSFDFSDDIDLGGLLESPPMAPTRVRQPVVAPATPISVRLLHAAEGLAWFVAGASLFGSTALAGCLLGLTAVTLL